MSVATPPHAGPPRDPAIPGHGAAAAYALAPVFSVRAAGVPFEPLAALGTPALAAAARRLLDAELALEEAAAAVIASPTFGPGQRALRRALKQHVLNRRLVAPEQLAAHPWLAAYHRAAAARADALAALEAALPAEEARAHAQLLGAAVAILPDLAVIESPAIWDELAAVAAAPPATGPARSGDRATARALAMYLQRVCAKTDTIYRFGPSGWGRVDARVAGIRIAPAPELAGRCIEVERWAVVGLLAAINADPDVRDELCPRVHPDGALEAGARDPASALLRRLDTGAAIPLDGAARALLAQCDGATPAHAIFGATAAPEAARAQLVQLAEAGAVVWELERYAVDASPMASLIADVAAWRPGAPRARWLPRLEALAARAAGLAAADSAPARRAIYEALGRELAALGVAPRDRGRTLYAAGNAVSENCSREQGVVLGADAVARLVTDAAPWLDLFRDAYALGVARAFAQYRAIAERAPRDASGRLRYAALVAHAQGEGVDIETDGALLRAGAEAYVDVQRALADALANRADAPVWELSAADCHAVRRRFDLPPVAELAYPQADVQLAAASPEGVARGDYTWVVAELHHAFMPLQHALYWSCPDKPALHAAMQAACAHRPVLVRGALSEQPVHVAGEGVLAALPRATFVGRGRAKPGWRVVPRARAEVIVDDAARDVRLSDPHTGQDLGSLVRGFRIMMGMHPFFPFERAPHAPRLRLGNTVVQRATWRVQSSELGEPRPVGVSAALLTAVERLRRARGLPRWVFARPAPGRLAAAAVYARDKDHKPVYLDLESVVFLEIFERRLRKFGELVLSEMLPAPGAMPWREPSGHFVFELRTSIVPGPASPDAAGASAGGAAGAAVAP
jgi:hypothetical protein